MINDVEILLNTHGIKYKKKGDNILCLCPNHNDKHIGSFSFNLTKKVGHCFACGYSCNIFSLNKLLGEKMEYNGNVNYEFVKSLKPKQKEEIKYNKPIVYGKMYSPFYDESIMNFLHNNLGWGDEFIDFAKVKFCRYSEMIAENLSNDLNEKATPIENRICIPIYKNGELVNYECRTFVGNEKKVLYVKGCSSNLIYNFDNINFDKPVIITESIKNLGKGWGVDKNIISTFGNQISDVKLEMLNRYVKDLILFADFDDGGLRMVQTLKDKYEGNLKVTFCPKKYRNKENKLKGFDMNDCDLNQIKYYLQPNRLMSAEKAIQILSYNEEDNIFW